tara:strand:- start:393 stop:713 length:321 start_codon:yes stop_codon:yes gene_type:complete
VEDSNLSTRLDSSPLKVKTASGGILLTLFFLFVVIVVLVILVGYAYRSDEVTSAPEEPARRLDRLATTLDPDLMEKIIQRARIEGGSEVEILNRLLRERLEQDPEA